MMEVQAMRMITNKYTRGVDVANCRHLRGKLWVRLTDEERREFEAMRVVGKTLQNSAVPAEWVRNRSITRDLAKLTIALAGGWREFSDDYPVGV